MRRSKDPRASGLGARALVNRFYARRLAAATPARWTAEERSLAWRLAWTLRICVLIVFTDTDSSAAISCRDRFVGERASVPDD
jgi:hypothetical protein